MTSRKAPKRATKDPRNKTPEQAAQLPPAKALRPKSPANPKSKSPKKEERKGRAKKPAPSKKQKSKSVDMRRAASPQKPDSALSSPAIAFKKDAYVAYLDKEAALAGDVQVCIGLVSQTCPHPLVGKQIYRPANPRDISNFNVDYQRYACGRD